MLLSIKPAEGKQWQQPIIYHETTGPSMADVPKTQHCRKRRHLSEKRDFFFVFVNTGRGEWIRFQNNMDQKQKQSSAGG